MGKVRNINDGGVVGIQTGSDNDDDGRNTETVNVNRGGTVGIQGDNVQGCTVVFGN